MVKYYTHVLNISIFITDKKLCLPQNIYCFYHLIIPEDPLAKLCHYRIGLQRNTNISSNIGQLADVQFYWPQPTNTEFGMNAPY